MIASMTPRRSSFPSAARPSSAPMAMKRSETRKPHSPNWKDMNATNAPTAMSVSLEPRATIDGLANGTAYACEVAAVAATGAGTGGRASIAAE